MVNRFQPNRIFRSHTHRRTAGSAPAPARPRADARRPTGRDQLDPPLRESSRQIDELRVVRPFVCANCVRIYNIYDRACVRARIYMRMHLYPREFVFVYTHKCKRSFLRAYACMHLRACLHADLIKTQNAFARTIFQHSNALWVQKLSRCTIHAFRH